MPSANFDSVDIVNSGGVSLVIALLSAAILNPVVVAFCKDSFVICADEVALTCIQANKGRDAHIANHNLGDIFDSAARLRTERT
jgi:hypothetical protein